eukprot:scaffold321864_cov46-Prasinocladus_malaysianus.AAC.1
MNVVCPATAQETKLQKNLDGLAGRLANEKFVASAPAKVVDDVRAQKAEAEEQLAMVQAKLEQSRDWIAGEGNGEMSLRALQVDCLLLPVSSHLMQHSYCSTACGSPGD